MTENGWQPSPRIEPNSPLLVWKTVPGTNVRLQVRNDDAGTLMLAYAADYDAYVEPLVDRMTACYTPTNSVSTSNHLNATAMDFNWDYYPWKRRGNLTGDKLARLRKLLAFYNPWMFWAGDWDDAYVDEMHHQLNYGSYELAQQGRLALWVKANIRPDGLSVYRRAPVAAPVVAATDSAAKVLYDAVPVIDEARAAELVGPVMAGLALAQCTNVQRIAMALAQWGHESDGFKTTQEYGSGQRYAPYIGRTWIQITWQANYASFGRWAADQGLIDDPGYFVDNPAALADLKWAGIGAAWYWTVARPTINGLCDQGDIVAVTQLINGGQNGIADRRQRYQQAIALGDELLALIAPPAAPDQGGPLDALTPQEQHTLFDNVMWIREQMDVSRPDWDADADLGQDSQGRPNNLRTAVAAVLRKVSAK
jgi:predicted chitinase